jgi:hypothetical protein
MRLYERKVLGGTESPAESAHAVLLYPMMLKVELVKYPIEMEIVNNLVIFMIYHKIDSIPELIQLSDEEIKSKDGFESHLLQAIHVIRGIQLN